MFNQSAVKLSIGELDDFTSVLMYYNSRLMVIERRL